MYAQNKAERKVTREQTLLKKNPVAIKEELDKLEAMGELTFFLLLVSFAAFI